MPTGYTVTNVSTPKLYGVLLFIMQSILSILSLHTGDNTAKQQQLMSHVAHLRSNMAELRLFVHLPWLPRKHVNCSANQM